MSARSRSRSAVGVGLSTLVTIMVTVLLTTFAVLTLVSARADLKLSNKTIESTQSYYAADSEAEEWLAALDAFARDEHGDLVADLSAAGYQSVATAGARVDDAAGDGSGGDAAGAGGDGVLVGDDGRIRVAATFPIDEKRDLIVEIALDREGEIDILRWQSVSKR
jgi:hypothetical protein